jgi:hypothetical protein
MVFFRRNKIPKINPRLTQLDSNQNLKALLANEAYNKPNERKRNIMNFQLDEEFNDTIYAVYQNPQEKRVILAIRGTASASDLLTDVRLAIQQVSNLKTMDNSGRFQKLNRVLNDIFSKYSRLGYNLNLTGHSLAGFETMRLEDKNPEKVSSGIAFNAGSTPMTNYKIPDDIQHIRNPRDLISYGFRNDPNTVEYVNNQKLSLFNPLKNHTINYFL